MKISNHKAGFIFLEILISVGLISSVLAALLTIGVLSLNVSSSTEKITEIDALIKEELEGLRSFRDGTTWSTDGIGSSNYTPENSYYISVDNSTNPPKWNLSSGAETLGAFTRNVVFSKVSRNPLTGDIEAIYNQSNDDPDTRKATITVNWSGKSYQVISYFTNWK